MGFYTRVDGRLDNEQKGRTEEELRVLYVRVSESA